MKIVVTLQGGCVTGVFCSTPDAEVEILDADDVEHVHEWEEMLETETHDLHTVY